MNKRPEQGLLANIWIRDGKVQMPSNFERPEFKLIEMKDQSYEYWQTYDMTLNDKECENMLTIAKERSKEYTSVTFRVYHECGHVHGLLLLSKRIDNDVKRTTEMIR